ncbi:MAG TPA: hypothetical protein VKS22_09105 [Candidatus Binataceae bacterium]|nr:hypothetical protein [Candidatus Binataceae bacterium]
MARALDLARFAIGVAYPFLIYFGLEIFPPRMLAAARLARRVVPQRLRGPA